MTANTDVRQLAEAAVDIYFSGHDKPEEERVYVPGAFRQAMEELRAALAKCSN